MEYLRYKLDDINVYIQYTTYNINFRIVNAHDKYETYLAQ